MLGLCGGVAGLLSRTGGLRRALMVAGCLERSVYRDGMGMGASMEVIFRTLESVRTRLFSYGLLDVAGVLGVAEARVSGAPSPDEVP